MLVPTDAQTDMEFVDSCLEALKLFKLNFILASSNNKLSLERFERFERNQIKSWDEFEERFMD